MVIILDKNLYGLKDSGLTWFEKIKKDLEARGFVQSQLYPCLWYKEEMVLLFYVDGLIMFSPSKDKIDDIYSYLQSYLNIEYDRELKKYLASIPSLILLNHSKHE